MVVQVHSLCVHRAHHRYCDSLIYATQEALSSFLLAQLLEKQNKPRRKKMKVKEQLVQLNKSLSRH